MFHETVHNNSSDHQNGETEGDDDVAGNGEEIGDKAKQVGDEHEHEQREHEREKLHALRSGGVPQHVSDEFVGHLGDGLKPARNEAAARRGEIKESRRDNHGGDHEQSRVGEGQVIAADVDRNQLDDMELVDRIDLVSCHVQTPSMPRTASLQLPLMKSGHFHRHGHGAVSRPARILPRPLRNAVH